MDDRGKTNSLGINNEANQVKAKMDFFVCAHDLKRARFPQQVTSAGSRFSNGGARAGVLVLQRERVRCAGIWRSCTAERFLLTESCRAEAAESFQLFLLFLLFPLRRHGMEASEGESQVPRPHGAHSDWYAPRFVNPDGRCCCFRSPFLTGGGGLV